MKLIKIILLTVFLIGCSQQTFQLTGDFNEDAIQISNIIDKRMIANEELTDQERHQLELFVGKYATESQQEKESLVATYLTGLYRYTSEVISEDDVSKRLESMNKYNELMDKLKTELENK